jgi:HD-GYP domain-containing protein (c-di-GMP phosphodiesterase class II)
VLSVGVSPLAGRNQRKTLDPLCPGVPEGSFKVGVQPDEFEMVKRHPTHGWEICRHLKSVGDALPCIRSHHEKLDGSGYPDKLSGDQIPRVVRIMSIADVYDALASARSYKPAFAPETCFRILREEAERGWWDKELVTAFVDCMQSKGLDKKPPTVSVVAPSGG